MGILKVIFERMSFTVTAFFFHLEFDKGSANA